MTFGSVAAESKSMESRGMEKVEEAIKSIPEKKENLRKALDSLRSYSSSLPDFNLQWKDLEDHFSAVEKSIDERLKTLQEKTKVDDDPDAYPAAAAKCTSSPPAARPTSPPNAKCTSSPPAARPTSPPNAKCTSSPAAARPSSPPNLRSICANMDAELLQFYIIRNDTGAMWKELVPAIRHAPDPALLVLYTIEVICSDTDPSPNPSPSPNPGFISPTCIAITLLEKLCLISPNISPFVREKATKLAVDWKSKIPRSADNSGDFAYLHALCLLHLIASYGIVTHFPLDDVLELLTSVLRSPQAVNFIKSLGLIDKMTDLIQKLKSKGRHLHAVKFVYAFDLVDKFPPVPLLKAYITESKKKAQEVRMKGNNSPQAENEAIGKELDALKSVLKAIEKYNLGIEYPPETLVKRIALLEQKKTDKQRIATTAAASNSRQKQKQPKQ